MAPSFYLPAVKLHEHILQFSIPFACRKSPNMNFPNSISPKISSLQTRFLLFDISSDESRNPENFRFGINRVELRLLPIEKCPTWNANETNGQLVKQNVRSDKLQEKYFFLTIFIRDGLPGFFLLLKHGGEPCKKTNKRKHTNRDLSSRFILTVSDNFWISWSSILTFRSVVLFHQTSSLIGKYIRTIRFRLFIPIFLHSCCFFFLFYALTVDIFGQSRNSAKGRSWACLQVVSSDVFHAFRHVSVTHDKGRFTYEAKSQKF